MEIEADLGPVADKHPLPDVLQPLAVERGELLEEAGQVDDRPGADQVDARRRDEAGGQDMEVVGDIVVHDCVSGVCS